MLSFLNIGILLGLLGVSIPFLIHLFAKRKQKKVYFSTLRFLKILQPRQLRRIQLKQILLMIIRGMIILFLVLGFARPVCKPTSSFQAKGAASVMSLIIDRSLSMKRSGMLQELKTKVQAVLEVMKTDDKVKLQFTNHTKRTTDQSLFNKNDVRNIVDDLSLSFEKGNLLPTVSESIQFLEKQKELNKEIFIFTDLQASEWKTEQDTTLLKTWKGDIFIFPIRGEKKNITVTRPGIERGIFQSEALIDVVTEVKNFSDIRIEDLLVRISLDDETIDQTTIQLNRDENKRVEFSSIQVKKGWNYGEIWVQDGSFPYDDSCFFVYHHPLKKRVLLIGNELEDVQPIELCLRAQDKNNQTYRVEHFIRGSDWQAKLDSSEVLVVSNYPRFSAEEIESMRDFLNKGGGILFFMGDKMNLQNHNQQFFQPVAGITLGEVIKSGQNAESGFSIRNTDLGHPLFQDIFERGKKEFTSPQIFQGIEFLGGDFLSIMDLSNGYPFMIEKKVGRGKIICISTSLQTDWSDFSYSTIFAPLMTRSIGYLSAQEGVHTAPNTVGQKIRLEIRPESMHGEFYLEDPEGKRTIVVPEIDQDNIFLEAESMSGPGIYTFFHNSTLLGYREVNIDFRESNFTEITPEKIKAVFPSSKIHVVGDMKKLEGVLSQSRYGRELWKEMIILALVLLGAEMVLAKSKKTKETE